MWFRVIVEFLQLISVGRQANECGLQKHATDDNRSLIALRLLNQH